MISIERTHEFQGRYHVLGGALSPIDGVDPEDLKIAELYERVDEGEVREVVIATNPTTTGEATALHIADGLRRIATRRLGHPPGQRAPRRRRPRVRRRAHARPGPGGPPRGLDNSLTGTRAHVFEPRGICPGNHPYSWRSREEARSPACSVSAGRDRGPRLGRQAAASDASDPTHLIPPTPSGRVTATAKGHAGPRARARCSAVGYRASGTLTSATLTPGTDGSLRRHVMADVTRANHRALKGSQTFTLADTRVRFGKGVSPTAPAAGDRVTVHGKLAVPQHGCSGSTQVTSVRSIRIQAPKD